jgi:thioredoxin 2
VPAARLIDRARCAACKAGLLPAEQPFVVSSAADFDELIQAPTAPVLVDFWADWCGPCRVLAPQLEQIAREKAGRLIVAKVDTDALPDVAGRFGIRSIPTMILFRGGKETKRLTGAMHAAAVARELSL